MQEITIRIAGQSFCYGARVALITFILACVGPAYGQKQHQESKHELKAAPAISALWNDPGDIQARDLFDGPGGKGHEPRGPMTFIQEDSKGTNPKFDLKDRNGETWRAKLGVEAQPETAAVRLLWAVGYFADADYFLPELKVDGMPTLTRGGNLVDPGGIVHNVRLKDRPEKKKGYWRWDHNPFSGTRGLNGLRVLMALINNWDLADENTSIYKDKESGREMYLVSDLGASFGTTGYHYYGGWSKNDPEAYARSKFISHVHSDYIDFNIPTHPPVLYIFGILGWTRHLQERGITKHIPRADVKWIAGLLAQLGPEQIRDAFRAAGYSETQISILARAVRERIEQLNQL